jgi:hypothetical protein
MVQWKGNLDASEAGEKAANLDSISSFDVPNFFVITKSEVGEAVASEAPQKFSKKGLPRELMEEVKDAYEDVGMSSEVRNASGEARNLVGNQRESQRVSVRISKNQNMAEYRLNVGASGLEEAIAEVLESYYEENSDTPALIIQKMIEPDYTGAVINDYTRRHSLVEAVEGLGHSLEEGITVPEFYLTRDSKIQDSRIPENQVKATRNPMSGGRRTRTVSNTSQSFQNSEIEKLVDRTSRKGLSVKFVYKRGSFYIVDAFESEPIGSEPDLEALKVSDGEITGVEGEDYILSDEPKRTEKPLVAKKGGYTSMESQYKRLQKTPAVVSLKHKDKIKKSSEAPKEFGKKPSHDNRHELTGVLATEVRPLEDFPELSGNPFGFQESDQKFADNCEEILAKDPEFVDARNIADDAAVKILESIGEVQVIALENPSSKVLSKAVEEGVEVVAVPSNSVKQISEKILRQEKRFILDNLRN